MAPEQVPVPRSVGAGAAGLSLSLLLLQQGVRPLLVERRADVSWYPRARNLNFRTLEVFRGLGLSEEVHRAGAQASRIFARERLTSSTQKLVFDASLLLDTKVLSPEPFMSYCPQSRLNRSFLRRRGNGAPTSGMRLNSLTSRRTRAASPPPCRIVRPGHHVPSARSSWLAPTVRTAAFGKSFTFRLRARERWTSTTCSSTCEARGTSLFEVMKGTRS